MAAKMRNFGQGSCVEVVMPDGPATPEPKLPEDLAICHGLIRELLATNETLQRRSEQLEQRLDQLLKRLYGPRADRVNPAQASLFGEPPPEPPPPPEPVVEATARTKPKGHGRRSLPANLRREPVIVDIPEAEKLAVGGTWVRIGEAISERLDYTPSSLFVRQVVRPKYVVRFEAKSDQLRIAELPAEALPKSKAAPGLVADIIVSKLVDHLPLYRQEKRYSRQGVELSRSTLCGWLAEAADVLTPLYSLLKARVLSAKVVHTDDTPIPVQDPSRAHCRTGRIWDYVSAYGVVYDATENHCRDGPAKFLQGFQGYLHCDAYAGYDKIFAQSKGTIIEVACWAHARRKFVEAEATSPQLAHEAVARIKALYAIEHQAKGFDADARAALRQREAKPRLDALKEWLDREQATALPKTPIGEAITYALNQWEALNVYIRDGDLAIDNNAAERAVKPFAIGRRNWMFFGSDRGGRTLAILASFTATCELLKLNPWTYLKDVLTKLPSTPTDQLATLLPTKCKHWANHGACGSTTHPVE
jgi:transposase